ncbi:MAG: GTPase ObgE [Candidatus Gastranaerophilales bacterium]|nr:GTPase ObgE [Candidatus Gastranaerophilales bacterium]
MAQFIDKVKIKVESGRGGRGIIAWRREKYVDKGGPDGGDGGSGGSVYFIGDVSMTTLLDFTYKSVFQAQDGENGRIKNQYGKNGKDVYIKLPVGTVVRDLKTGNIIADINEDKKTVLIAKGGRGGRGNTKFASAKIRAPQFCEPGEASVVRELELELKLIADIGLLGLPNAGKSSFISRISSAKPKIADYPFTTLVPHLGVVKNPNGENFVVADIPGLIEGAHEGTGLGFEFLRHVERCKFFIHVIDMTENDPVSNYKKINLELEKYSKELSERFQVIMLNKADIISKEKTEELYRVFSGLNENVFAVSAVTGFGIKELMNFIYKKHGEIPSPEFNSKITEDKGFDDNDDSEFEVIKLNKNTYSVNGGKIRRLAGVVDVRNLRQIRHLANILDSMGVFARLKEEGLIEGDTIFVSGLEMTYNGEYG